jgi:hypothetical protein
MASIQGLKWAGQSDLAKMIQAKALTEGEFPDCVNLIVAEVLQMDSPRRLRQIERAEQELGIEIRVTDTY